MDNIILGEIEMIFRTIRLKYGEENIDLRRKVTFEQFKSIYNNIEDKINFKAELKSNESEISIVQLVTLTVAIMALFIGEAIKNIINKVFNNPNSGVFDRAVYFSLLIIAVFMLVLIIKSSINFSLSKRCLFFIEQIEEELKTQKAKENYIEYLKKEHYKNIEILSLAIDKNKKLTKELIEAKEISDILNKKFESKEITKS